MGSRVFEIDVEPPFSLGLTAWALRRRRHNLMDRLDSGAYRRVAVVGGRVLEIVVSQRSGPRASTLVVELHHAGRAPGVAVESSVDGLVRRVLGLDVDLAGFYRLAEHDPRLADV